MPHYVSGLANICSDFNRQPDVGSRVELQACVAEELKGGCVPVVPTLFETWYSGHKSDHSTLGITPKETLPTFVGHMNVASRRSGFVDLFSKLTMPALPYPTMKWRKFEWMSKGMSPGRSKRSIILFSVLSGVAPMVKAKMEVGSTPNKEKRCLPCGLGGCACEVARCWLIAMRVKFCAAN